MNMLSKVIKKNKNPVQQKYVFPSGEQLKSLIAERQNEMQRRKVIDGNKNDPIKAARTEANKILAQAQEKIKEAELEAVRIRIDTEKEVSQKLEQEFKIKLEQQTAELKENYRQSLLELANLRKEIFKNSEEELIQLVFSITKRVIGEEIASTPAIVLDMLRKSFAKLPGAQNYLVKVNPADFHTIQNQADQLKKNMQASGQIKFEQDDAIEPGGCRIVTENGEVSAEPGKQLDIIKKELTHEG
jgi:flagellar assembly protein FliH